MAGNCQSMIRQISNKLNSKSTSTDKRLIRNVVSNLATQLQELTTNFKTNQNIYLKSRKNINKLFYFH